MTDDVRPDPRQVPARADLLLAAGFEQDARGRPIHGRIESEDGGTGEPGPWLKIGAVRTSRLTVSEGTDRPSGSAYGNALRGTRDDVFRLTRPGAAASAPRWCRRRCGSEYRTAATLWLHGCLAGIW